MPHVERDERHLAPSSSPSRADPRESALSGAEPVGRPCSPWRSGCRKGARRTVSPVFSSSLSLARLGVADDRLDGDEVVQGQVESAPPRCPAATPARLESGAVENGRRHLAQSLDVEAAARPSMCSSAASHLRGAGPRVRAGSAGRCPPPSQGEPVPARAVLGHHELALAAVAQAQATGPSTSEDHVAGLTQGRSCRRSGPPLARTASRVCSVAPPAAPCRRPATGALTA